MTDITIPPAALEAGRDVLLRAFGNELHATVANKLACDCFLAIVEGWPGVTHMEPNLANGIIILPLTEKTDDKA